MNLESYFNLLVSLQETIKLARQACLAECASELQEMYELIYNVYCEAIDIANEIKIEQEKGDKDE